MGRLLAVELARQGHRVEVYDAGSPQAEQSAATVAAAMLAPLAESAITEPGVVRIGQLALPRWQQLDCVAEPSRCSFQQAGTLIVWHRQDAAEAQRFTRVLEANQQTTPELPPLQKLDSAALAQAEPTLAGRFNHGLYLPGEGQLDNRQLLTSLLAEMTRLGVQMHWNAPARPRPLHRARQGNPTGCWTAEAWALARTGRDLRGVRGEVVRLYAPDVTLQRPPAWCTHATRSTWRPSKTDIFVIGATEIESTTWRRPACARRWSCSARLHRAHWLCRGAHSRNPHPGRPTLPDNLPAIRGPRRARAGGQWHVPARLHDFAPAMLDVTLEILNTGQSQLSKRFDLRLELLGQPARRSGGRRIGMKIFINNHPYELPEGATVTDAVAAIQARPPFAVAVNTSFVPNTRYASTRFAAGRPRRNHLPCDGRLTPQQPMTAHTPPDSLVLYGHAFTSRLLLGTSRVPLACRSGSRRAHAPQPAMVTASLRRQGSNPAESRRQLLGAAAQAQCARAAQYRGLPQRPRKPSPPPRWPARCSTPRGSSWN